ncbi:MAG: leucine-rich repeat protein [Ruminococcus sp.]|nr:leucine-rich repeat protein [Ruminococcus sp.]
MKKLIAILLALSLLLMFAACGSGSDSGTGNDSQSVQEAGNVSDNSVYEGELTEESLRNYKVAPESDFKYCIDIEDDGNGVSVTGYTGKDTVVVIPETIDGQPVTEVCCWDFANDSPVRGVYCPPSVKRIGAFGNNDALEIVICEGAEELLESAFIGCSRLRTVVLGDNLKKINGAAFGVCKSLTEVYIAPSMTEVEVDYTSSYAMVFFGADNLTVKGEEGSFIESFCEEQGVPFEAV